jgi:hypothetical protein
MHFTCNIVVPVIVLLIAASSLRADERASLVAASLGAARDYLVSRQDPADGAWRSGVHGSFRDGPSLTPHVLSALFDLSRGHPGAASSYGRGLNYLLALDPRSDRLNFPVYSAAEISWVLGMDDMGPRRAERLDAQRRWVQFVRDRQLNARLGWDAADPEFGGWGYSPAVPLKPAPGAGRGLMVGSNLSATVFAIGALRRTRATTQIGPDDPIWRDILVFADRCQNFADDPAHADPRFDDGGFFFAPGDAAVNKAGPAGADRSGRERYHSYGSMTCDGLWIMLQCGRPVDHPRVVAARRWLERNFSAATSPGRFNADRARLRDGTYYYYCWSLAHALARLRLTHLDTPGGRVHWPAVLRDELLARQRPDGSWRGDVSDAREDDPLVATPFAAAALLICQGMMEPAHAATGR